MPKSVNAPEKLRPSIFFAGAMTNLKHIKDIPEIVCCNMLFTDDIVARVSSLAKM